MIDSLQSCCDRTSEPKGEWILVFLLIESGEIQSSCSEGLGSGDIFPYSISTGAVPDEPVTNDGV